MSTVEVPSRVCVLLAPHKDAQGKVLYWRVRDAAEEEYLSGKWGEREYQRVWYEVPPNRGKKK